MENEILLLLAGAIVTGISQFAKKFFPKINSMVVVAVISLIAGAIYVLLDQSNTLTADVINTLKSIFGTAVVLYNIFKQFNKPTNENENMPKV